MRLRTCPAEASMSTVPKRQQQWLRVPLAGKYDDHKRSRFWVLGQSGWYILVPEWRAALVSRSINQAIVTAYFAEIVAGRANFAREELAPTKPVRLLPQLVGICWTK